MGETNGLAIEGDIPVVCTQSGAVYILSSIVLPEGGTSADAVVVAVKLLRKNGASFRIVGRRCAGCTLDHLIVDPSPCIYRPLRGPLFVPR